MGCLLNHVNSFLASLLNRSVTGLGSVRDNCVDIICNKDISMSVLVSQHFFIVLFRNIMHSSACTLLLWLYDDDTACQMLSFLWKFSNISEIKFVPV